MCNAIKSNGEKCKLAPSKDRCGKHPIIAVEENNESSNIIEMPPQVVVDMPAPSAIKPVEASIDEVSKVPELNESKLVQVIAKDAVYNEDESSDLELNNSIDEDEFYFDNYIDTERCSQFDLNDEMKQFPLSVGAVIDAVNEYSRTNNVDIAPSLKPNSAAHGYGYHYCFYIQQGKETRIHYYCKSQRDMDNFPELLANVNVVSHCLSKKKYNRRLFGLSMAFKKSWFQDSTNLWMLAGHMATKPHANIHEMMRTYSCVLKSNLSKFDLKSAREYLKFEHLLKSIEFQSIELLRRFVSYFIHEFYVFDIADSKQCYFRCRPTKENPMVIRPFDMGGFQKIKMNYLASNGIMGSTSLAGILSGLPIHKFEHTNIIWNPPADETTTFSLAAPFKAKYIGETEESELPDDLMHYLKDILCDRNEAKWIWLRTYLVNLFWQPNERTQVMLLLYSQKKRCGKSTLKDFIQNCLIGERNVQLANSMGAVFGERGCPGAATAKLVWFEELTDSKTTFRTHMDRMKTAITDDQTTYRPLYKEFVTIKNRNEYIAATNHLVGVLEDRFTVFKISEERCGDVEFYAKLRAQMPGCADKFVSYLKDYTSSLPMKIHQTPEYESMLGNSSEAIVQYLKDIKETCNSDFARVERPEYIFSSMIALYGHYSNWCEENKEKALSWGHFKEKVMHYEPSIEWKKIKVNGASNWHFTFPLDYFNEAEAEDEDEAEEVATGGDDKEVVIDELEANIDMFRTKNTKKYLKV